MSGETLHSALHRALHIAPRRFRMPPLPDAARAANALGRDAALAFAIESVRVANAGGASAGHEVEAMFLASLAQLIRDALAAEGDAAFQALVLRSQDAEVRRYVQLAASAAADRRAVRTAVDAIAHPGKLRADGDAGPRAAMRAAMHELHGLHGLHALAAQEAWAALQAAATRFDFDGAAAAGAGSLRDAVQGIASSDALARLAQGEALRAVPAVRRYLSLCERQGPAAGSQAAAAQGRASKRAGGLAEEHAIHVFREVAALIGDGAPATYRVVRGLRTPAGFPGDGDKAKDEWDAALLRCGEAAQLLCGDPAQRCSAEVALLAEVKASPSAAAPDYPRLLRGLLRLSHAQADSRYVFASAEGPVELAGASLRMLRPHGRQLPQHVIYFCTGEVDAQPPWLGAAAKAVLLGEPASVAFAMRIVSGEDPPAESLREVWDALPHAARLRSTLHQFETAKIARDAMLHPDDLLAAVRSVAVNDRHS